MPIETSNLVESWSGACTLCTLARGMSSQNVFAGYLELCKARAKQPYKADNQGLLDMLARPDRRAGRHGKGASPVSDCTQDSCVCIMIECDGEWSIAPGMLQGGLSALETLA